MFTFTQFKKFLQNADTLLIENKWKLVVCYSIITIAYTKVIGVTSWYTIPPFTLIVLLSIKLRVLLEIAVRVCDKWRVTKLYQVAVIFLLVALFYFMVEFFISWLIPILLNEIIDITECMQGPPPSPLG